jgi:hypothetical protein
MTILLTGSAFPADTVNFAVLAIPCVITLLLALVLRSMFSYARGTRALSLKHAAGIALAPTGVVFMLAMILRVMEAMATR